MIHLCEGIDFVGFTIPIGINAANHPAPAFLLAQGTLLINTHKQFAGGGGCEADWIIYLRWLSENSDVKSLRSLYIPETTGGVTPILGRFHYLAWQLRQGASVGFYFPYASP